jgi:hypothetical protein
VCLRSSLKFKIKWDEKHEHFCSQQALHMYLQTQYLFMCAMCALPLGQVTYLALCCLWQSSIFKTAGNWGQLVTSWATWGSMACPRPCSRADLCNPQFFMLTPHAPCG